MEPTHREQEILDEIRLAGGSCRIGYLAERLGVSDETIRRNIKSLQARALVRKVHGGVLLSEGMRLTEQPFQARMRENARAKRQIGAKLASLVSDGDSLFLDIGTTTAYAAQALRTKKRLYVVTNSLTVATTLATINSNRVFFPGGELRAHDGGAFGGQAIDFIKRFNVQHAVLSVGAIDANTGFMLHDLGESDLSRAISERAQTRIILADSSKFTQRAPVTLANQEMLDILISDTLPPTGIAKMLQKRDIAHLLAA